MKLPWNKRTQIVFEKKLGDIEIQRAFAVGESTTWFHAVLQLLNDYREEAFDWAATHVANGNSMAAAGSIGAGNAIQNVIEAFSKLREDSMKKELSSV